jgi:adenine phosphoribosyltransferase
MEGVEILKEYIRDVPDFPTKGILFKDITPLLGDGFAFHQAVSVFEERYRTSNVGRILAIEARGFVLGGALASLLGIGMVPLRKPGKLPYTKHSETYTLEYGETALEIHTDAVSRGETVVILDDVLATGGTALAATHLAEKVGAKIMEIAFLIELDFLEGRKMIDKYPVFSLLHY